jgi:uncharacterized protein YprB with RNaseH-like and TPR domain
MELKIMIIKESKIDPNGPYSYIYNINLKLIDIPISECIFFDIETTGLSKTKHMIYLIGACFFKHNTWHANQYLATGLEDEEFILKAFFELIKSKKYLLHFNGTTFDIPFISHKAKHYNMESPITLTEHTIVSIDLYKLFTKFKNYLNFKNYKLTTIETNLNIHRKDSYSGAELIKVYYEYIKHFSLDVLKNNFEKSKPLEKKLLLHNYEDIVNLVPLLCIYSFNHLKEGKIRYVDYNENDTHITLQYNLVTNDIAYNMPCNIEHNITDDILIKSESDNLYITLTKLYDTFKFFYPDYKNYYYLPNEDYAIHKSVGQYVDKEHRETAKASNCYIKKEGIFIPLPIANDSTLYKYNIFKTAYNIYKTIFCTKF